MKKIKVIFILCICLVAIINFWQLSKFLVEDANQFNQAEIKGMSITEYRAFLKEKEIVLESEFESMLNSQRKIK